MKQSLLFFFLCLLSGTASAQATNNGATIVIESGAKLTANGTLQNQPGAVINCSGELVVLGNLKNAGSLIATSAASAIIFEGSSPSIFTVGTTNLLVLKNKKTGADLSLVGDLTVGSNLDLTNANNSLLNLNDADLTLAASATITGASTNSFIATDGAGFLIQEAIGSGTFIFPVGNAGGGLTKLDAEVTGTSFANARLKVNVNPTADPNLQPETDDYTSRHWEVVAENITDYRNEVTATYLNSDVVGNETPIKGASYGNGEWFYLDGARQGTTLMGTIETPEATFTGSGFDASVLPVELSVFSATKTNESSAHLFWSTASEENTAWFSVERSTSGVNWTEIGQVAASGQSDRHLNYTYDDKKIAPAVRRSGLVYYRLNIVDFDGRQEYSPVKSVQFEPMADELLVYPNPTANVLYVDHAEEIRSITVYNSLGQAVISVTGNRLDLSSLSPGEYQIGIVTKDTLVFRKVVKVE